MIQRQLGDADFVLVDLRTPDEIADGYIEGAVNIDFYDDDLRDQLNTLDRDKTYVIYCRSGNARDRMRELGFTEVYNVVGGINSWRAAGLPVVP